MKILQTTPFSPALIVSPGDKLIVTWYEKDENGRRQVAETETVFTESRTLDTAILVDFPPEEAKAFGLKTAIGCIAGEKLT